MFGIPLMQNTQMTHYEHPLTEKVRIYLRLDYLFRQMHHSSNQSDPWQYKIFFHALFDLLEILDQVQVKTDLAKDIEKQRQQLMNWLMIKSKFFVFCNTRLPTSLNRSAKPAAVAAASFLFSNQTVCWLEFSNMEHKTKHTLAKGPKHNPPTGSQQVSNKMLLNLVHPLQYCVR